MKELTLIVGVIILSIALHSCKAARPKFNTAGIEQDNMVNIVPNE